MNRKCIAKEISSVLWRCSLAHVLFYSVMQHNNILAMYRVRLKRRFPSKTTISQNRSIFYYAFLYDYSQGLSALLLHTLWNSVNLYRNGRIWNTKYDFCKSPASNAEHLLNNVPKKLNYLERNAKNHDYFRQLFKII